ncbi:MAG: MATE family efflux transporter [Oscillibacter sp.]|nr:MATE family efflux transporter [Oscillibacter sp.]
MTEGSPLRHILLFALPLLAGSFLQQFYNTVDSWVVGNYVSDAALAAVGVGFPVMFLFTSFFTGVSLGGTVVIAQAIGAGKPERVRAAVDTLYAAFIRSVVPLTAITILILRPLLRLLRVDESAMAETHTYLLIVCAGLCGTIGYNLNAGILNGLGNSHTTLLFLAVSTVVNIILDLVLVLACSMGVAGVALGTAVAQGISWLFGVFYINRRYPDVAIRVFTAPFDRALFMQIIKIGLPTGLQLSVMSVGSMFVLSKINSFGKAYTAGFNVGNKLDMIAFLPVQSISSACTTFVGQNIGAARYDRARTGVRESVLLGVAWTLLSSALLVVFSEPLSAFFTPEGDVITASCLYLRGVMPPYFLFTILFLLNAAMRSAGDSIFPMVSTIASVVFIRAPVLYYIADRFGPEYMYWSFGIGWLIAGAATVWYYLAGKWKGKSLAGKL